MCVCVLTEAVDPGDQDGDEGSGALHSTANVLGSVWPAGDELSQQELLFFLFVSVIDQ